MMKTLARLFTLKPYGRNLLDGTGEIWMFLAAINILSIAICDAIAWAYFGYTTAPGVTGYVTAALAGMLVLTLVGSLDAMFVMHDRSNRGDVWRERLAIGARVVLVILTFTVTAPFLTQLVFARDIDAAIQRRNESTIGGKRAEIAARLASRQRDLEKEIAGAGASGRYGRGPTAAAIEREIVEVQSELAAFDEAVKSPTVLANRYGIDLVREGPDTRARVIAEMEKSESFRATRRTIKAFLLFMFLGLVCLKLFQPEAVRIYYSAKLQSEFARMQAGIFSHRMDAREGPVMTPVRFAEWYENDLRVREVADRLRERTSLESEMQDILRADDIEAQVAAKRQELNALNAKIASGQQALDDFRYDDSSDLSLADQQLLISSRNRTARQVAENRAAAAAMASALQRLEGRLETTRTCERQFREALS